MNIFDILKGHTPVKKGLYSGRFEVDGATFRAHLRVEEDGEGILSLNASRILHLNRTATEIAYHFINGLNEDETINLMKKRYRVGRDQLKKDVESLYKIINTLGKTDKVCPLSDLGISLDEPYTKEISAPMRVDVALTYKCQNRCSHCYNEPQREVKELDKEKWFEVIKKIESVGIPHIVFTGGEPTLIPFLDELIAYSEDLGIVTGLNTNGRKLKDLEYVKNLKECGLDHIQITLESPKEEIHDEMVQEKGAFKETLHGLKNSLQSGIFTMTNTTIVRTNKDTMKEFPSFLKNLGINTFAVNSIIFSGKAVKSELHLTKEEIIPLLEEISKEARENDMKFIWYTPTRYCELNPLEMGLGVKQCTAARLSLAIEPNGDVLPCQSYYKRVGNILKDDFKDIWNNELCKKLRVPQKPLKECKECAHLSLCGGGCPLENDLEPFTCREVYSQG